MFWTLVDIIILLLGITKYNKDVGTSLFIAVFFFTNNFIIGGNPVIKHQDIGLLYLFILLLTQKRYVNEGFDESHDFEKILKYFMLCFVFSIIYSIVIEADSIGNIITVVRTFFVPIVYYVFRKAPKEQLEKSIRLSIYFSVLSCILFCAQYFTHINLINTYINEDLVSQGSYRMQVTPPFVETILLYVLLYSKNGFKKFILISLFSFVLIVAENRTPIIILAIQIVLYFLFTKAQFKQKLAVIAIAIIAYPLFSTVLSSRSEGNSMTIDYHEVRGLVETQDYGAMTSSSTFLFRIAHLSERLYYIIDNPKYALFGVGAIHEDSPCNRFDFSVGTQAQASDGKIKKMMINTGDILWSTILLRYGMLGIFAVILLLYKYVKCTYEKRDDIFINVMFLNAATVVLSSLTSAGFISPASLMLVSFVFLYIDSLNNKNLKVI